MYVSLSTRVVSSPIGTYLIVPTTLRDVWLSRTRSIVTRQTHTVSPTLAHQAQMNGLSPEQMESMAAEAARQVAFSGAGHLGVWVETGCLWASEWTIRDVCWRAYVNLCSSAVELSDTRWGESGNVLVDTSLLAKDTSRRAALQAPPPPAPVAQPQQETHTPPRPTTGSDLGLNVGFRVVAGASVASFSQDRVSNSTFGFLRVGRGFV